MAHKTLVTFEDDIDGTTATETVSFGLDGVVYDIDLSEKNATKLRAVLQRYTNAARRLGGRSTRRRSGRRPGTSARPAHADREQTAAIRAWARENGWQVSDRGRVAAAVVEAYNTGV
jgi:hypothetical protein